ncbi:MAG: hypothetical protein HYT15_03425 [Candidatus Magasanikbacteria bacterium]|nr:hypothetical protein [Candidatus Magasanikbacteria bacterium]
MKESFFKHIPKPESGAEEPHKQPKVVDIPAGGKEKKIDADPIARYTKTYHKIMLDFGHQIINSKEKSLAIPNSLELMIKNCDTDQLVGEIENTKKEDWKRREVLFKAITDEIYLRLWEARKGSKRKTKSADIIKVQ